MKYIAMWSYQDNIGQNSGHVEIFAKNKKDAEKEFYKVNRKLILGFDKQHKPIFNPNGGFVCESILTYDEWVGEGKPTSLR